MRHDGFTEEAQLQGCKSVATLTEAQDQICLFDYPAWSCWCLQTHHRLIWSRVLREGEEVFFFLADNRHTLMSRTSIGREGESIFAFWTTSQLFEFFAHLCFDRMRMRQLFENFVLTPFVRLGQTCEKMASALYLENFLESELLL